ncbi:MAG: TldD/PmbA family protein [Candidatus Hodarchaeota archaeon]
MEGIDFAEYALEQGLKEGASYVEARFEDARQGQFILKNGVPELGAFDRSKGLGIRLLANGGMGFASLNDLTKKNVEDAVREAVKLAKRSGILRKHPIEFSEEKVYQTNWNIQAKERPSNVDPERKMAVLFEMDKSATDKELPIPIPYRIFFLFDTELEKYYVNSEGTQISSFYPVILYYMVLTALKSTGQTEQISQTSGASGGYELLKEWDLPQMVKERAIGLGKVVLNAQAPPKGTLDFVLGSQIVGIICHENSGHPSEADRILGREGAQAGESYLKPEMLGSQIASEYVTIIDDPTLPGSAGFYLFDDEGVKARPRYLIRDGIFTEMLHNRETAKLMKTQSTGASRGIGFNREPIIRMANTYMAEGDYTEEELIEDVKLGIFMKYYQEWNIDDRRFQSKYVGSEAYLIENGEIKSLIRRPVLETTTPGLFKSIDACSKGLEFEGVICGKGDPMQGAPVWHGGAKAIRLRNIIVR